MREENVMSKVILIAEDEPVLRESLAELLAGLEPRRQEVVRRYFWAGESSREIAEALGVSVSRVQQLRQQAQEQLRTAMTTGAARAGRTRRKKSANEASLVAGSR